jgi:NADH:ubiquinone oxidoreductase subunit 5 (subunit L)/multisubunit Na+/H+ antiporter MnhA subunit
MATATAIHPEATHHLPFFITPPGETDILMNVMVVFLALIVFLIGILYLRLHALPEHMAHRTQKVQYEIVAVLALISLFTPNHIYWIIGLLLALVQLPDFSTPLARMADSLAKMAGAKRMPRAVEAPAPAWSPQDQAQPVAREAKDLRHA